jgi:hypothetical protein
MLVLLLLLATWFDGAFALRHWGPVAILALGVSTATAFSGAIRLEDRWVRAAVVAIFALAGWSTLSAIWAESPGRALEGGARSLLYASLFFIAVATPAGGKVAARVGGAAMAGVGLIAAVTLALLLTDGTGQFLAGRLDDPVGYRNATACLFSLAFWPFVAVAARQAGNPFLRACALSGALLVLGLAFLTQARGTAVGLLLGGVVALALGPDRLRRIWVALLAGGGIALISGRLLTPYDAFTDDRAEAAADIAPAVEALAALVIAGFAVGLAIALLDGGLRMGERLRMGMRTFAGVGVVVVAVLAVAVTVAAIGNPVTFASDRFNEFRSLETAAPGETRLTFGGGQRSDLWRVALLEFSDRPLAGVGEGSYPFDYYQKRRNDRNLSTPHGLPFELLAEKGLVGALAFLAFLIAIGLAVARRWRAASPEGRRWASVLLAAAAVVLGQSVVDWIWLIPGVTGLAFLCAGLALAALSPPARTDLTARSGLPWRIAGTALVAIALVGVALVYLADVSVRMARAPGASTSERLDAAQRAEGFNPYSLVPRYLQAGAYEELGRPGAARRELLGAVQLEPNNFVTLGLLGDLELRAGREAAANGYYQRAAALNPLDAGLTELVRRTEDAQGSDGGGPEPKT